VLLRLLPLTPPQRLLKALLWLLPPHLATLFSNAGLRASAMQASCTARAACRGGGGGGGGLHRGATLCVRGARGAVGRGGGGGGGGGCHRGDTLCVQAARGADAGVAQAANELLDKLK
jgi:uncharacterized membrane protein